MSKNITLHREHGLNPTIPVCFWCGEEKGEIALLGNKYKGEAPRHMVMDYEPCLACQERFKQGILVIEADTKPVGEGQPPFNGQDAYPTGNHVVIKEESFVANFSDHADEDWYKNIMNDKVLMMEPEVFQQVFGDIAETE